MVIPHNLVPLFWDVKAGEFDPADYPAYTIARVLEYGDERAFAWLKQTFPEGQIQEVVRHERRLTPKSANFWALVYSIPRQEVAALTQPRSPFALS